MRSFGLLLVASAALAAPLDPRTFAEAEVGLASGLVRIHLEPDGFIQVDSASVAPSRFKLSSRSSEWQRGEIRAVTVEGHPVAHVRVSLRSGRAEELVLGTSESRVQVFVDETTGSMGDGDRATVLDVGAHLDRFQTASTIDRCDGEVALFRERYEFAQKRFVPLSAEVMSGPLLPTAAAIAARPRRAFQFTAESTNPLAAESRRADRLAAPRELEDENPATRWNAGRDAVGQWVTARASLPHQITRLRIDAGPGAPRTLALVWGGGTDQRATVHLTGKTTWVAPSIGAAKCLSLVIVEPAPAANTSLAEVGIYTELDEPNGLAHLITSVVEELPGADAAAKVILFEGKGAIGALLAAVQSHAGPGRRRLLEILVQIADPLAAPALADALKLAAADERTLLVSGLVKLGAFALPAVQSLYLDAAQSEEARTDAAKVLGVLAQFSDAAINALIDGLTGGLTGGDDKRRPLASPSLRAATRAALASAKSNPRVAQTLEKAIEADTTLAPVRLSDLARALATVAAPHPSQAAQVATHLARLYLSAPDDFELRLRLLRGLAELRHPAALPAIEKATQDANEILRLAGFEALAAQAKLGDGAPGFWAAAIADSDPRIRLLALSQASASESVQIDRLAHDPWPMVRKVAAAALARRCDNDATVALSRTVVGQAADPSEAVRREALLGVAHCLPRSPLLVEVLGNRKQSLGLRELAAVMLSKSGDPAASRSLASAVDQLLADPSADERSQGLVVACLRALTGLGDVSPPIVETLGQAAHEMLSPSIRAAAMQAIGALCPVGAQAAFKDGDTDSDPWVRRASAEARRICKK